MIKYFCDCCKQEISPCEAIQCADSRSGKLLKLLCKKCLNSIFDNADALERLSKSGENIPEDFRDWLLKHTEGYGDDEIILALEVWKLLPKNQ